MKPLVTVSADAAAFLNDKLAASKAAGILIGINKKGCAGGEYEFDVLEASQVKPEYEHFTDNGVTLYWPRHLLMKLIGSELVLFRDRFNTRLDLKNPNETSRCGCGESIAF